MQRLDEIIQNTSGVSIYICAAYSLIFGFFYIEIYKFCKIEKKTKFPLLEWTKTFFVFPAYMLISVLPGLILSRLFHPDYGGASFACWFFGFLLRRFLHTTKVWRGPPEF
jgi:O-antigen/teichoic acid export membrane protein